MSFDQWNIHFNLYAFAITHELNYCCSFCRIKRERKRERERVSNLTQVRFVNLPICKLTAGHVWTHWREWERESKRKKVAQTFPLFPFCSSSASASSSSSSLLFFWAKCNSADSRCKLYTIIYTHSPKFKVEDIQVYYGALSLSCCCHSKVYWIEQSTEQFTTLEREREGELYVRSDSVRSSSSLDFGSVRCGLLWTLSESLQDCSSRLAASLAASLSLSLCLSFSPTFIGYSLSHLIRHRITVTANNHSLHFLLLLVFRLLLCFFLRYFTHHRVWPATSSHQHPHRPHFLSAFPMTGNVIDVNVSKCKFTWTQWHL